MWAIRWGLAYKAQNTDCDEIAFWRRPFQAETRAKILNPDKTVILPVPMPAVPLEASCDAVSWKPS